MNCKPNDLAWKVKLDPSATGTVAEVGRAMLGIPVRITHLRPPRNEACVATQVWNFETPVVVEVGGSQYEVWGCADEYMRPIKGEPEPVTEELREVIDTTVN